jgi:SAM-dependent methyltransferase
MSDGQSQSPRRRPAAGRDPFARDAYHSLGKGFGRAAERYDQEVGKNAAMRYMRQVSLETLEITFKPGQTVIEVGCGTGEEAVHLSRRGICVLATDVSSEMIAMTARRVADMGVQDMVQTRCTAAGELSTLIDEYGPGSFDGGYSSFGPLNGERDLRTVCAALAVLIRTDGRMVVSVMNRFYPLETAWYLLHGHPYEGVRRWKGRAMARVSPARPDVVPTWYYTPGAFARAFAPSFRRVSCRALPLLLPSPPLATLWIRAPRLLRKLIPCEEWLSRRWPFCALGDHFLMVLRRT